MWPSPQGLGVGSLLRLRPISTGKYTPHQKPGQTGAAAFVKTVPPEGNGKLEFKEHLWGGFHKMASQYPNGISGITGPRSASRSRMSVQ
jgi:hypothetical protein